MKSKIWMILIIIVMGLAACDGPSRATPPPGPSQTWIDAPLDGSTLPLLPYKLVFHGASYVGVTEFEIKINGTVTATLPPLSSGSGGPQYGTLFLGEYDWDPPAPGIYLISVRAKGNGQYSLPDQVQVTISGGKSTPLPIMPPPTPTNTPVTPVPVKQCTFTALIDIFCRLSSGSGYQAVDNFVAGQSAPVVGQSTDGYFWYVLGPNYGELCTVPKAAKYGETEGACEDLVRFTPIPLPTDTDTPTPRPTATRTPRPTPCPTGVRCP